MTFPPIRKKKVLNPLEKAESEVKDLIKTLYPVSNERLSALSFQAPPPHVRADYSFSTFFIGEELKEDITLIAQRIVDNFNKASALVKELSFVGPYVNVTIEKEAYNEHAIDHLTVGGGPQKKKTKKADTVAISYFISDAFTDTDLARIFAVGASIGKCIAHSGSAVMQRCYVVGGKTAAEEKARIRSLKKHKTTTTALTPVTYRSGSEFSAQAEKMLKIAFAKGVAQTLGTTNAVVAVSESTPTPVLLRKQDGTLTSVVRHLCYIKELVATHPREMIFLCLQEDTVVLDTALALARHLGLLPEGVKLSILPVPPSTALGFRLTEDEAQYALLRCPYHKKLGTGDEGSAQFQTIKDELHALTQATADEPLHFEDRFRVIAHLLNFPKAVDQVVSLHNPASICMYLEELVAVARKVQVGKDARLAHATGNILEKGLKLLGLTAPPARGRRSRKK